VTRKTEGAHARLATGQAVIMRGFLAAADAMVTLGEVVAALTGSALAIDHDAAHQFSGISRLRIGGRPWKLTATADPEDPHVTLELSRKCPRSWSRDPSSLPLRVELFRLRMENRAQTEGAEAPSVVALEDGVVCVMDVVPINQVKDASAKLQGMIRTASAAWQALA
jgi:hypothetical protein